MRDVRHIRGCVDVVKQAPTFGLRVGAAPGGAIQGQLSEAPFAALHCVAMGLRMRSPVHPLVAVLGGGAVGTWAASG